MQVAFGTYVGDGQASQVIAGLGFTPQAVFLKSGEGSQAVVFAHQDFPEGYAGRLDSSVALESDCVLSLNADGFTVGSDNKVNYSEYTYHWMAVRDNGNDDLAVGTYTGDGSDNRSISGVGFQPDFVLIRAAGSYGGCWRTSDVSGDYSALFNSNADAANLIQALEADGFQVGSASNVNANGVEYVYLAVKKSALTAGGTYTGDGTDDRSLTGVGFQPDEVWVKRRSGTGYAMKHPATEAGDYSHYFTGTAKAANNIQSLLADGFQVGSSSNVNADTYSYRWWAWKAGTLGTYQLSSSDSLALTEQLGDREFGAADALALSEQSLVAIPKSSSDAFSLSEAESIALALEDTDSLALTEAAALEQGKLISRLELTAEISNALRDQVMLSAEVFHERIHDRLELQATISPQLRSQLLLEAMVVNEELETAGQGAVIAPVAEVTFL